MHAVSRRSGRRAEREPKPPQPQQQPRPRAKCVPYGPDRRGSRPRCLWTRRDAVQIARLRRERDVDTAGRVARGPIISANSPNSRNVTMRRRSAAPPQPAQFQNRQRQRYACEHRSRLTDSEQRHVHTRQPGGTLPHRLRHERLPHVDQEVQHDRPDPARRRRRLPYMIRTASAVDGARTSHSQNPGAATASPRNTPTSPAV